MVIGYCGKVPRNTGIDSDIIAQTEADHLGNCPVGGALVDMRDLGQVLAHVRDQEIETGQGRLCCKSLFWLTNEIL